MQGRIFLNSRNDEMMDKIKCVIKCEKYCMLHLIKLKKIHSII